jgi:hypothetical protein
MVLISTIAISLKVTVTSLEGCAGLSIKFDGLKVTSKSLTSIGVTSMGSYGLDKIKVSTLD